MSTNAESLTCWVYRSPLKAEMYLYLRQEGDFESIPLELLQRFGAPQLVMGLELCAERTLAREDVATVMINLRARGFHLQLPPRTLADALPEYRR